MSKQASRAGSRPRSLTQPELQNVAAEFDRLGRQLEGATDTLRAAPENPLVIDDMRLALSQAGRCLLRVVHHGAVDGPTRMPPWLSWSFRDAGSHPRFSALRGFLSHSWSPSRNVRGLFHVLNAHLSVAGGKASGTRPASHVSFRHRQVFLEATAGWLGHRCSPRVSIQLPSAKAEFASDVPTDGAAKAAKSVAITFDWDDQSPTKTRSLFLEIGRAASAACRHLAAVLANCTPSMKQSGNHPNDPSRAWQQAASEWRRHVVVVPAMHNRPARAILNLRHLMPPPVDGIAYESCEIDTDPDPSARALLRLANDPGAELFERIALQLADATAALAPALEAASIDSTRTLEMAREIRRAPRRPQVMHATLIEEVGLQVDRLDARHRQTHASSDIPVLQPSWHGLADAAPKPAAPPAVPQRANTQVAFTAIERAVALLRRDGEHPRSMRDYAKDVGVSHTTLSRSKTWQTAWQFAQSLNGKSRAEMPQGATEPDSDFDAWRPEVCENCRLEEIFETVTVGGERVRVCEACAAKLKK